MGLTPEHLHPAVFETLLTQRRHTRRLPDACCIRRFDGSFDGGSDRGLAVPSSTALAAWRTKLQPIASLRWLQLTVTQADGGTMGQAGAVLAEMSELCSLEVCVAGSPIPELPRQHSVHNVAACLPHLLAPLTALSSLTALNLRRGHLFR